MALLGITPVTTPIEERRALRRRLAGEYRPSGLGDDVTEVTLDTVERALDAILAGDARGRWIVRIALG